VSELIPESHLDVLEKKALASLATIMPDGGPHVTPVWVMYEAPYVIVNTARGRVKERNIRRDSRVAVSIYDPDDIYRYVGLQGRVVEMTERDGREVIDALAKKYLGRDVYPGPQDEIRVTCRILPERVWTMG
jgi:PPOX class probable F420-dependent enzyme